MLGLADRIFIDEHHDFAFVDRAFSGRYLLLKGIIRSATFEVFIIEVCGGLKWPAELRDREVLLFT